MMDAMDAIGAKGAASGPDLEGRGLRLSFGPGSKERHCPVMDAGQGSTPSSTRLPAATAHASAGRRVGRANGGVALLGTRSALPRPRRPATEGSRLRAPASASQGRRAPAVADNHSRGRHTFLLRRGRHPFLLRHSVAFSPIPALSRQSCPSPSFTLASPLASAPPPSQHIPINASVFPPPEPGPAPVIPGQHIQMSLEHSRSVFHPKPQLRA